MVHLIENLSGRKAIVKFIPSFKEDMDSTWADNHKAKKLLNWKARISFKDGLKKFIEWYEANKDWLNTLEMGG